MCATNKIIMKRQNYAHLACDAVSSSEPYAIYVNFQIRIRQLVSKHV